MSFRIYLTAAVLLFSLGIVSGVYSPPVSGLMTQEMSALKEWADRLAALPPALMAVFILLKNCFALLFSFAMSPLLGLVPVLTLTLNGWLIGVVAVEVSNKVSPGYFLAGVLPHGILEIPALMIGEAAALGFGVSVFYSIFRKNAPGYLAASFKKNFRYLIIAMLLLVPAALIETFITPLLLR